ncbi:integrin-linked protein kinase [Schistocerca americana]|uniref:integrin-linked protein kinase n=1 Tax=Schistocerca americana TaxID=7009 RepID=UPI001F4F4BA6|nr:integrin-linked protein kinase [Schistocerca americana]XP_049784669.1 integrin-linked protein kinase [Schistocerca cancellata]XP_049812155.1 integrin-linked protein kinase [Schistocerca nitens]
MEDIFQWCREGNAMQVRVWLDDTEHDMNQGDDHGFSPLHWSSKEGHLKIVDLLILRGARINATNRGDDTPLHLAAAHGHRDIVQLLLRNNADVNFTNEHGNTPLHYACFWGYQEIAQDLVQRGALVSLANKDGDTPLDKARGSLAKRLHDLAVENNQDLKKINFKDQSWLGLKTRSRDATLSRHKGINIADLALHTKIATSPSGETWRGRWQKNEIVAKILAIRECTSRISRDFNEEFPKLRIFSHPNVLPVVGCCNSPPNLVVISQYMPWGSLYTLLHEGTGIVVDTAQAIRFALDVARGMAFLHSLERIIPQYHLNSRHVMIDDDLTARINMADAKFSFQEKGRVYYPAWMSPEALQKKPSERNWEACDMWSYAILLWELATREVPFADYSPMEVGMKIALEGLRISIPPGISSHLAKLIRICMNEDPGKRPTFDMVLPILDKMKR